MGNQGRQCPLLQASCLWMVCQNEPERGVSLPPHQKAKTSSGYMKCFPPKPPLKTYDEGLNATLLLIPIAWSQTAGIGTPPGFFLVGLFRIQPHPSLPAAKNIGVSGSSRSRSSVLTDSKESHVAIFQPVVQSCYPMIQTVSKKKGIKNSQKNGFAHF